MVRPSNRKYTKRQSKRIEINAHASIRHEDTMFSGELINVSDMGAYLATNAPYSVNDAIDLIIDFQHGASKLTMTIPGKVARIDGRGIGLISSHIDANMLLRLELVFDINRDNPKLLIEEFCKAIRL